MLRLYFLLCLVIVYQCVHSYPNSVPNDPSTCMDMKPKHGPGSQQGPSPFEISISKNFANRGEVIEVTLAGIGGTPFLGFFLQARGNEAIPIGEFLPGPNYKLNTCAMLPNNVAHHGDNNMKNVLKLLWRAPINYAGPIAFTCTFVKDFTTFWMKQTANQNLNII